MSMKPLAQALPEVCATPALRKLDDLMRREIGVGLILLAPLENLTFDVHSRGRELHLPEFCKLMRGGGGLSRCTTCRSMLAFAAMNRGPVHHSCHGGLSVIAAPVQIASGGHPLFVVVSSCAFTEPRKAKGWAAAKADVRGLKINLRALRKAYGRLPVLRSQRLLLATGLVDAAAAYLAEVLPNYVAPGSSRRPQSDVGASLQVPPEKVFEGLRRESGKTLVQIVAEVVRSNPAPPYSVQDIARAAHITPNHFSALFRKHAGQTFGNYLVWMRLALAQEHLRDLKLSIREAADKAGFSDPNYFARRFREKTGVSPRAWRAAL